MLGNIERRGETFQECRLGAFEMQKRFIFHSKFESQFEVRNSEPMTSLLARRWRRLKSRTEHPRDLVDPNKLQIYGRVYLSLSPSLSEQAELINFSFYSISRRDSIEYRVARRKRELKSFRGWDSNIAPFPTEIPFDPFAKENSGSGKFSDISNNIKY